MTRSKEKVFAASSSRAAAEFYASQAPILAGDSGTDVVNGDPSGVSFALPAVAAESDPKFTMDDLLAYLQDVKYTLQDEPEKYDRFLDVVKNFTAQRVDKAGIIGTLKELFEGHSNLILGLNMFFPATLTDEGEAPNYSDAPPQALVADVVSGEVVDGGPSDAPPLAPAADIVSGKAVDGGPSDAPPLAPVAADIVSGEVVDGGPSDAPPLAPVAADAVSVVVADGGPSEVAVAPPESELKFSMDDVLAYLKEVKSILQDQKEKYTTFLKIVLDFKAQRVDIAGLAERVQDLFKEYPDLMIKFNKFLPPENHITLTEKDVEEEAAPDGVNKIVSGGDEMVVAEKQPEAVAVTEKEEAPREVNKPLPEIIVLDD